MMTSFGFASVDLSWRMQFLLTSNPLLRDIALVDYEILIC